MSDLTFTTIEEIARAYLKITRDDYAACNYIACWSIYPGNKTPGWCNRTKGQMADFIGISGRGLLKMLDRLNRLGLIERRDKYVFEFRVTELWFNSVITAKNSRADKEQSSPRTRNDVHPNEEQSSPSRVNKVHPHNEGDLKNSNEFNRAASQPDSEKPLIHQMVLIFEQEHKKRFQDVAGEWIGFTWQAKEFGALKSLDKEFRKRLKARGLEISDQVVISSWTTFLKMAGDCDKFILDNWFTPTKLWGNFQSIIQKITKSNGQQQSTNKGQQKSRNNAAALGNILKDVSENGLRQ